MDPIGGTTADIHRNRNGEEEPGNCAASVQLNLEHCNSKANRQFQVLEHS